jgi:Fic family protein
MKEEQFLVEQRQHLVKTIEGAVAFVPPQLPPTLDLSKIAAKLATTSIAIGELNGAARRLQNPYMIVSPLIRKEALTSSAMEGTFTTIDDMIIEEVSPPAQKNDDAREAYNYVSALKQLNEAIKTYPVNGALIREGHKILLSGLSPARGAGKKPGEYKIQQNAIGQSGDTIFTARYVPPPPMQTVDCMEALDRYITRKDRIAGEELIDIALIHYQFEAIHPFQDGNGRMGRMLITLLAQKFGLVELPLLHISSILENQKPEYINRLHEVSTENKWIEWIDFFLSVTRQSCLEAISIIDKLLVLQVALKQNALKASRSHRLATIIDALFDKHWTTAGEVEKLCGVSFPTAQSDIQELVKLEILTPIQNTRPAIFVATQIVNLSRR